MIRRIADGVVAFFILSICACVYGQSAPENKVVALRCGSLFDGRGDALRKNVVVVIEGEKIKEVGSSAPAGAEAIDLSRELVCRG